MSQVEITKADGTTEIVGGSMNDKLFAYLGKSRGWVSYRIFDDGVIYEMTEKDKDLKDYCDSRERIERAMNY